MIRMTLRNKQGEAILRKFPGNDGPDPIARLALYEETGLAPEEIKALIRRLEEKSEAMDAWSKRYFELLSEVTKERKAAEEAASRKWWQRGKKG